MFRDCGMIEAVHPTWTPGNGSMFRTTPKGNAFIEALLNTPEPVQSWTVPAKGD